ncbi:MAG: Lrp/AsnC ligand binding domain-containing protein [Halobacteria archaeon]
MPIGIVLINVEIGKDREVYEKLIKKFKEVYFLFGKYDLIIKLEVKDFDELSEIVFNEIRTIEGIKSTTTLAGTSLPDK